MSRSFVEQISNVIRERQSAYGSPSQNHQLTADFLSRWMKDRFGVDIEITAEDVCTINILQKISRLAYGTKDDGWLDIVGYGENVAQLDDDQRNVPSTPRGGDHVDAEQELADAAEQRRPPKVDGIPPGEPGIMVNPRESSMHPAGSPVEQQDEAKHRR